MFKLSTCVEVNGRKECGTPTSTLINDIITSIFQSEAISGLNKIRLIDNTNTVRQEILITGSDMTLIDSTLKIEKTFTANSTFTLQKIEALSDTKVYFTYTISTQITQNTQYKITITITINSSHTVIEQPSGANTSVNDLNLRKRILYRLRGDNVKTKPVRVYWAYVYPSIILLDTDLSTDRSTSRIYHDPRYFTRSGYLSSIYVLDADLQVLIEINLRTQIWVNDTDQAQYSHTILVG